MIYLAYLKLTQGLLKTFQFTIILPPRIYPKIIKYTQKIFFQFRFLSWEKKKEVKYLSQGEIGKQINKRLNQR